MFNFTNSDDDEISYTMVKMHAPIGPKEAEMELHHCRTHYKNGRNNVYANEVTSKIIGFPFADCFDIIER